MRIAARSAAARIATAARIRATGTPVIRSTRSGHQAATEVRTASKPPVRAATYASSTSPWAMTMCSRPSASARSVPGVGCRCRSAWRAVAVTRGSMTISRPPASRIAARCRTKGGMVSATFPPASSTASARARSVIGNGRPRSMPKARPVAAAAEDMQNRPL
ncbi:hypothetical protein GCM10017559_66000 [Streptosporangium longisporum]|uniref:Uncharacterized protein n=1 Tax=Streptosporangium longisporum TaxID=46187 RepID=A0ABP6L217_9ACTN